jgi:hypothetical protein
VTVLGSKISRQRERPSTKSSPDISLDFLEVRDGYLQILDYKPDTRREKHAHVQLTIYALALTGRANLPLKHFKCAWFDEKDYFEFFPLKGVYSPKYFSSRSVKDSTWATFLRER